MGTRQYIGARYVPKFFENPNGTAEWLSNVIYEPLTIVTYSQNSYTSKKAVPASVGNPADNPEYWVASFNFNAQFEELENRIDGIDTEITDLDGRVEEFEKAAYSYGLCFGNSYMTGANENPGQGVYSRMKDMFTESSLYSSSGCGFTAYDSDHSTTFNTLLANAISTLGDDCNKVTDVFVLSAVGECRGVQNNTNITSAVTEFCNTCRNNFPNLKKITIALGDAYSAPCVGSAPKLTFRLPFRVNELFDEISKSINFDYIGWIGWSNVYESTLIQSDKLHPNNAGAQIMADNIKRYYRSYMPYYPKKQSIRFQLKPMVYTISARITVTPYESDIYFNNAVSSSILTDFTPISRGDTVTLDIHPSDTLTVYPNLSQGSYSRPFNFNFSWQGTGLQFYSYFDYTINTNTNLIEYAGVCRSELNGTKSELSASSNNYLNIWWRNISV